MPREYSNRDLQQRSFKNEDLRNICFYESDLRGVDFSGSDLSGASFVRVKTGITPINFFLIFLAALLVSALSGYVAMLAGATIQKMLDSTDWKIKITGVATILITLFFLIYTYLAGGQKALTQMMVPIFFFSIVVGGVNYFSGAGTGKAMLYELVALLLVVIMLVVGTIARTIAGSLSNVLFVIVALTGGLFSKSLGGGIGTFIMAISCALISKRALSGAKGFEAVRNMAAFFTLQLGTSFRNSILVQADFSQSEKVQNCDFSNADTSSINWGNCRKMNCIQ